MKQVSAHFITTRYRDINNRHAKKDNLLSRFAFVVSDVIIPDKYNE